MGNRSVLVLKFFGLVLLCLVLAKPCQRIWWLMLEQHHLESQGIPSGFTAIDYLSAAFGKDWS